MQWRRVAIGRAAEAHERDVRPDVHLVRPQLRVAMALPKGEVARARRSAKAMEGGRSGGDASRTFPKEPWLGGTCAMQTETETKCARKSSKVIQKVPGGTRRPWKVRGKAVEDRWEGCGRGRSEGKPWKTGGKAVEGQWERLRRASRRYRRRRRALPPTPRKHTGGGDEGGEMRGEMRGRYGGR